MDAKSAVRETRGSPTAGSVVIHLTPGRRASSQQRASDDVTLDLGRAFTEPFDA